MDLSNVTLRFPIDRQSKDSTKINTFVKSNIIKGIRSFITWKINHLSNSLLLEINE